MIFLETPFLDHFSESLEDRHTVPLSRWEFSFMVKDKPKARDSTKEMHELSWALRWYQSFVTNMIYLEKQIKIRSFLWKTERSVIGLSMEKNYQRYLIPPYLCRA